LEFALICENDKSNKGVVAFGFAQQFNSVSISQLEIENDNIRLKLCNCVASFGNAVGLSD